MRYFGGAFLLGVILKVEGDMMDNQWLEQTKQRLRVRLQRCVPNQIRAYLRTGGPTDADRERVSTYASDIGAYGDIMLFPDDKTRKGDPQYNDLMDKFVDAVAVAVFSPGGICCFGLSFEVSCETEPYLDEMQRFVGDIDRILEM